MMSHTTIFFSQKQKQHRVNCSKMLLSLYWQTAYQPEQRQQQQQQWEIKTNTQHAQCKMIKTFFFWRGGGDV